MKLKPMADNVLLKQHEAAETTASGIILATTNKEKPMIYEIVSVGPGTKDVEMTVKAGGLSLLQGIFPTQESNPGLPHCRQIIYCLSHGGKPSSS